MFFFGEMVVDFKPFPLPQHLAALADLLVEELGEGLQMQLFNGQADGHGMATVLSDELFALFQELKEMDASDRAA